MFLAVVWTGIDALLAVVIVDETSFTLRILHDGTSSDVLVATHMSTRAYPQTGVEIVVQGRMGHCLL